MKLLKKFLLLFVITSTLFNCFDDDIDDNGVFAGEIEDFVWKGMNFIYLYKDFKPDLANDRFTNNEEYANYLNSYSGPQDLFNDLLYNPDTIDEFSFLVDDYIELEQLLNGTTVSNGMEFGLRRLTENSPVVFGYVRYVLPNTSAETEGVQRGYIFDKVDGTTLYFNSGSDNNLGLLNQNSYTINLATYDNNSTPETADDSVISGTESITLTKSSYTENPVFKTEIINVNGNNVGYLMYNGFTANFDSQLNSAFGNFASSGITNLVLDLRYNPGGSVSTATWLASMITGQFTDQIFIKEQWNSEIQAELEASNPEFLINPFTDEMIRFDNSGNVVFQETINHLNLDKVYILTTGSSASASELIINGLNPYIEVVQIGTTTTGKYQASRTLYDSPNFSREDANPNHTYALQPLVFKSLNKDDVTDYFDGLSPEQPFIIPENYGNLGVLGDVNEPLLAAAIADIEGSSRMSPVSYDVVRDLKDSKDNSPIKNRMYTDKKLPISR